MSVKRLFILIILVIRSTCALWAHQPLLWHYTVRDGLPSNVIYDIFQDSKGYIWFCTDQGVSRFDGTEFRNYSPSQGLPDNEIFRIREDDQHRYWLVCYNFKACYIFNDKVYSSSNDALCRRIEQEHIRYESVFRDINGDWCLGGRKIGILKGNRLLMKLTRDTALEEEIFSYFHDRKEYLVISKYIYRLEDGHRQQISNTFGHPALYLGGKLFVFSDDTRHMILERWTPVADSFQRQQRTVSPSRIMQLNPLPDGNILCCSTSGIFLYEVSTGQFRKDTTFPGHLYGNHILLDREGNQWLGTVDDGVYLRPGATPQVINRQSGLSSHHILSLSVTPQGDLVAGDDVGNVSLIKANGIQTFSLTRKGFRNRILFAFSTGNGALIAGGDIGVFKIRGKRRSELPIQGPANGKAGIGIGDYCLIGVASRACRYHIPTGKIEQLWEQRTTAIVEDRSGIIWLGSLQGLYYYQHHKVYKYRHNALLAESRITCLAITPEGHIAAGTSTHGLFIIPDTGSAASHLQPANGLSGNSCKKVIAGAGGCIWSCSENGLDRISRSAGGQYSTYAYPLPEGLSGRSINDMVIRRDQLCLATTEGIVILNNRDGITRPPLLYIQSVNDSAFSAAIKQPLILPYDRNSVQVKYTGISFAAGRNVNYKYFLVGANNDTTYTNAQTINFGALKPGRYELMIWARNLDGPWTPQYVSFRFHILSPWWLSLWALGLAAMLFALIAVLVYKYRIRNIRLHAEKVARNKQQIAELEMKALRAQINPHFVFNALNSIQTYYSLNDERKANHYMTSFAQFIRKTLTHSQAQWLSIAAEVEMLQTYIELEQMRFKQFFSFTITWSPQIEPEAIMIPAMLIQPYVENAINHGLRHLKDRKGMLSVRFELKDHILCCVVEDNGIGLQQARKQRSSGHQSLGMNINRQRIEAINQLYQTDISMSITEKQLNNLPTGTLIEIKIPLKDERSRTDHDPY